MIRAELHHLWVMLGYAVRPYDMLADRRRWAWQRRTRCFYVEVPRR